MTDYYQNAYLTIRPMLERDAQTFIDTFNTYGWHHDIQTYQTYFSEQESGARKVYVAEFNHQVAGYCTVLFTPRSGPWRNQSLPELSDLRVFNEFQHQGIASTLLDVIEHDASRFADTMTLAVGLHSGYGKAQRLYVKRGYVPDGSGVWYEAQALEQYADCCNDDSLVLYMSKNLN